MGIKCGEWSLVPSPTLVLNWAEYSITPNDLTLLPPSTKPAGALYLKASGACELPLDSPVLQGLKLSMSVDGGMQWNSPGVPDANEVEAPKSAPINPGYLLNTDKSFADIIGVRPKLSLSATALKLKIDDEDGVKLSASLGHGSFGGIGPIPGSSASLGGGDAVGNDSLATGEAKNPLNGFIGAPGGARMLSGELAANVTYSIVDFTLKFSAVPPGIPGNVWQYAFLASGVLTFDEAKLTLSGLFSEMDEVRGPNRELTPDGEKTRHWSLYSVLNVGEWLTLSGSYAQNDKRLGLKGEGEDVVTGLKTWKDRVFLVGAGIKTDYVLIFGNYGQLWKFGEESTADADLLPIDRDPSRVFEVGLSFLDGKLNFSYVDGTGPATFEDPGRPPSSIHNRTLMTEVSWDLFSL